MTNAEVAHVFNEIAVLLELQGEEGHRVTAYRRVARSINDHPTDIKDLARAGKLTDLADVGQSSAAKVIELLQTGRISLRQRLLASVPESLLRLLAVPTLGPRKVSVLWKELGVESLTDLKEAIWNGKLESLPGFGPKTIRQIQRGIDFLERTAGRTRLGMAWVIATHLGGSVLAMKGVQRAEFAGSLRRGCETVRDLDLLCVADDGPRIVQQFSQLDHVTRVLSTDKTKGSVLVEYLPWGGCQVDLRVVPPDSFGAAWLFHTGSKAHTLALRDRAAQRGWRLSEHGLFEGDTPIASFLEEEIYDALDLPWIPPELRENRGEFDLTEIPRDLLTIAHMRGDLHMHTTASDGRRTAEQMVAAAKERGYEYVCITEHSQSSHIANGLIVPRLQQHIEDIRALNRHTKDMTVMIGAEVDILADGQLDYPDDVLAELDFVIASVHAGLGRDKEKNTRRTLAAIRNPYVNCIAHPTGRRINEREAMPVDVEAVCREAARTGTALEINANNYRLDLKETHARLARDMGVTLTINTDAHDVDQLEQIRFGVLTARRGWIRRDDVLNTRSVRGVREFVAAKRHAMGVARAAT